MTDSGPEAVRAYLDDLRRRHLEGDEFADLDGRLMATNNPMERIKLTEERRKLAERRRGLEEGFVRSASAWATAERIQRATFVAEGVAPELLDRAAVPE